MRVFGNRFSNWWWMLFIPAALVAVPGLLMGGLFMANNLAGVVFGPPAIWNRPWQAPRREDLQGDYVESERHLDESRPLALARLTLSPDGSMIVANLPADFGSLGCTLSGSGTWAGPDDDGFVLTVNSDLHSGSCPSGSYRGLEVAGHSKPYHLYWIVGDPDSGTGVWFRPQ